MCFDVADRLGAHAGRGLGQRDHLGLAFDAGSRVADLQRTVVVDRGTQDDGLDFISVLEGVGQSLQHHHAHAVSAHRPLGLGVKGAAVAVGRQDTAFFVDVTASQRHAHPNAAGKGHVALEVQEASTRLVNRHERRRAGRLDGHAGPTQIQLIRNPGGQEMRAVADELLQAALRQLRLRRLVCTVSGRASAGVDADPSSVLLRVVAGPFQRLPSAFQNEALLGIGQRGLSG